MQRALLLVNRYARRGQQGLDEALRWLATHNLQLFEESTQHPQHLSELITSYRDRVDLVIVGGGDGTLNAALAGLVETQLPLGILPLGTANDLARTLGIPMDLAAACEVIAHGHRQTIDLGWVNGRYFANVASLGISSGITQRLTREQKRRWGVLAYAATAMQVVWQTRPFTAEICERDQVWRVKTVQIAIGNGRFYGGGLAIAHDAAIDDRRLDLYSLELQHWWQIIPLLSVLGQGRQAVLPGVRTLQGDYFEIRTRRPHRINTDGELTTYTPARFRVVSQSLPVFVPAQGGGPGLSTAA